MKFHCSFPQPDAQHSTDVTHILKQSQEQDVALETTLTTTCIYVLVIVGACPVAV